MKLKLQELFDMAGLEYPLEELEREYVLWTLRRLGGNKTEAAKVLGVHIRTVYFKLKRWGLLDEFRKYQPIRRETELELYLRLKRKFEAEAAE